MVLFITVCFSSCEIYTKIPVKQQANIKNKYIAFYANGWVTDLKGKVIATYSNGYVLNFKGRVIATYSNGYVLNAKRKVIATYQYSVN